MSHNHKQFLDQKVLGKIKTFSKLTLLLLLDGCELGMDVRKWGYGSEYRYSQKRFLTCLRGLKRRQYILPISKDGETLYQLTTKGRMEAKKYYIKMKLKEKKWDGKWRLIIFDVPEDAKKLREGFRRTLKFLGCKKLQQSVWASPYDIFDDLEILIPDIKKHKWIKLIEANFIIGENDIKKFFGV